MAENAAVQSVVRAVQLLQALSDGPQSLGWLSRRTQLSKGTCHRLLYSLSYGQFVIQDPVTGNYALGPGCYGIGDAVVRGLGGLSAVASAELDHVQHVTQETVTLHVLVGNFRVCVDQVTSPRTIRYVAHVGAARSLHLGAMGKILLAFSDEDTRQSLLDHTSFEPSTDATITDRAVFEAEIETAREQGWAESREENVEGAAALSVPVLSDDGKLLAALSILAPTKRLSPEKVEEFVPLLTEAAQRISHLASTRTTAKARA